MATLKHNGTELARFERITEDRFGKMTTVISVRSNRHVLRCYKRTWNDGMKHNVGWKRYRKIHPGYETQFLVIIRNNPEWTEIS